MARSSVPEEPFPPGEGVDPDGPAVRGGPPYRIENSGPAGQEVYSYVDRVDTTRSQTVKKPGSRKSVSLGPRSGSDNRAVR